MFMEATQKAIQCALLQSALHGGMTVYFPPGRYCVEKTIVLPSHARLRGESHIGASLNRIESKNPCYIFQSPGAPGESPVSSRTHVQGLAFLGANILDLRANSPTVPAAAQITDCVFSNPGDLGSGVAIHLLNHDFSNIERSVFSAPKDIDVTFPIRISGWIDTVTRGGHQRGGGPEVRPA